MLCHLIKLAAGCGDIDQLANRQAAQPHRQSVRDHVCITTKRTPRRIADLLEGGSVYWVINHRIACRQAIQDIETLEGANGNYCAIWLDPTIVRTLGARKKPFQGWRYLEAGNAPRDTGVYSRRDEVSTPPPEMAEELRELGLL
jgi:hypothetical protein